MAGHAARLRKLTERIEVLQEEARDEVRDALQRYANRRRKEVMINSVLYGDCVVSRRNTAAPG